MKKLFLLDAFALIYRSYYAFIKNPRFNAKGLNTSAILGFTNTLVEVLEKEKPSHLAVVFDPKGKTFRHEEYPAYKAQRPPMPEEIGLSIPYIEKILDGFRIPAISVEGFEADDTIGTLAHQAEKEEFEVYMMTPDKDYAQLVTEHIVMYKPRRSGKPQEIWGVKEVQENFGIEQPMQVIDILGLMGDASDNIPGCPGVGPKTAQKLIADYGSIEGLYEHLGELKGKLKERVGENKEQVLLSKHLATIKLDVPIQFEEERYRVESEDTDKLNSLFKELEFASLIKRVLKSSTTEQPTTNGEIKQGSLFDDGSFGSASTEAETPEAIQKNESIETLKKDYYLMDTADLRANLRADLCIQERYAFYILLSEEAIDKANIIGLSFSFSSHEAFFVPITSPEILLEFQTIFSDSKITAITHDMKRALLALKWAGINIDNQLEDTLLAHYLLQPELKHTLSNVAQQMFQYILMDIEAYQGKGKSKLALSEIPIATLQMHANEYSDLCWQLHTELSPVLKERKVDKLYLELELPLTRVLAEMEFTGVGIDTQMLAEYQTLLQKELDEIEEEIKELAESPDLNVSSPKQLGEVLFEKMQLNSKARKTKTGQYSTSEAVLSKLKGNHPIVNKILQHRSLSKLISTYVIALPACINPKSGLIHTTFNQAETATGRLSSTNPNLQNIPIRTEQGRYIRKAFTPSDNEHTFLSADYSQVELRIMAHLSQDPNMLAAFVNNEDIHTSTAAKIFGVSLEEVTSNMRRQAKTANFGIIYGISGWGLAERLDISRSEGKHLIDGYFNTYPLVKEFMDKSIYDARQKGYVETLMGRRRYLQDINSHNAIVRGVAERNAINAPIQGTAADIIKLAMIRTFLAMEKAGLKSKMVLQVHDELNFNCLKSEQEALAQLVKQEMEQAFTLSVPLIAELGTGENWLEAH